MSKSSHNTNSVQGLLTYPSSYSVSETADRLEAVLLEKGMKVFLRIDHASGAASIDENLRPTELLIFGNPQVGTKLMQCAQSAGIDLPMKALVWQDENNECWIGFNDPAFLQSRHDMNGCEGVVEKIGLAFQGFVESAMGK